MWNFQSRARSKRGILHQVVLYNQQHNSLGSTHANSGTLGINRLSAAERLMLVQAILDSVVAEQPPAELSVAKQQELKRRLADHLANPDDVVPWEQVKADALARWQR